MSDEVLDAIGVGAGPFNVGLMALADRVPDMSARVYDARPAFSWHPGMMVPGAALQVSFLADLVTMVDPTSPWSFLNYLREHDRLWPFYITERFHIPRREYEDYCRWVAESLPGCVFGARVEDVRWDDGAFAVTTVRAGAQERSTTHARNVVLGVGTEPSVPAALAESVGGLAFHSAEYLDRLPELRGLRHVTVVGSGQSGAEVFLDLLRRQPDEGWELTWLTRSPGFAPMDYTKLNLEYTTPQYTQYFHALPREVREPLLRSQWQLFKAISSETIDAIYAELYERLVVKSSPDVSLRPNLAVDSIGPGADRGLRLRGMDTLQRHELVLETDAVVLATGYAARRPPCLAPLADLIEWDDSGRFDVSLGYRVRCAAEVTGGLFVQNAELHTHGAATPDLGTGANRNATIINQIAGREVYTLPRRTAFTTFGVESGRTAPTANVNGDGSGERIDGMPYRRHTPNAVGGIQGSPSARRQPLARRGADQTDLTRG
jgi:lysine N6-hydroxylase